MNHSDRGNNCTAFYFSEGGFSLFVWTLYCKTPCWNDNLVLPASVVGLEWSYHLLCRWLLSWCKHQEKQILVTLRPPLYIAKDKVCFFPSVLTIGMWMGAQLDSSGERLLSLLAALAHVSAGWSPPCSLSSCIFSKMRWNILVCAEPRKQ